MERQSIPNQLGEVVSKRLLEWLVSLACLVVAGLLVRYGDSFFDAATEVLGKQVILQIGSLLLFVSIYCSVLAFRSRTKKTVTERLRPVKGKGYSIDPLNGEAVCPRCTTDAKPVYLSDHGNALLCYVCNEPILK
jgi:hypothetical protein